MDKYPKNNEVSSTVGEQRDIILSAYDILDVHHELLKAADALWTFGQPNQQERTAIRIPLDTHTTTPFTAGKWQYYTSLSANSHKDDDGEVMEMTFTTPQVYDSIEIKLAMDDNWVVTPNGMSGPITTYSNNQLLRLLDAKLYHNSGTLDLIRRLPQMKTNEFPSEVMTMLEPLAKINTDKRTYSASDITIMSPTRGDSSGIVLPEYMSHTTAEIIRADGVEAVDYIVRLSFDGMPVQSELTDKDGTPLMSYIKNVYEHGFSVLHETGKTANTYSTFSVISDSSHDSEKVKQYVKSSSPERHGGKIFRNAIQHVTTEQLQLPGHS